MIKKEVSDISTGIVLLLFSIIGYVMAIDLGNQGDPAKYGPDFFPKLVLTLLAITSLLLFVNAMRKYKTSKEELGFDRSVFVAVFTFVFILIGYVLLFFVAGFIISTIVFLFIGQWAFGIRKIILLSSTSIIIPIALYLLFTLFFKVPLP